MHAVNWILKQCDELVIAIGSTQHSYEVENLFTAGERVEMMYKAFRAGGIADRCIIVPVPDVNNHALWVSHVNSLAPKYEVVFSNNPLVKELFSDREVEVKDVPLFEREKYDGTKIRKLMLAKGNWKSLVPAEVSDFIEKIKGIERLEKIIKGDKL
jgi:nicotinamide-nucleotide adenylyltransferase